MLLNRKVESLRSQIRPWIIGQNSGFSRRPMFGFGGQSNVDGARPIAELEAQYQTTYPNVKFYKHLLPLINKVDFVTMDASNELTYKAGNPNAGALFCFQFYLYPALQALLNRDIYICHHAYGGTALAIEWLSTGTPSSAYLYHESVMKAKAVKAEILAADGVYPDYKFYFFGQGEKDAQTQSFADNYQTRLTDLINNYRTAVNEPNLPFLIGRLNPNLVNSTIGSFPYWATVRAAQTAVAAAMTNVKIVNQDNAEMNTDNTHYSPAGYATIAANILSVAQANGYI
jgi:hypothetical protein